MKALLTVLFFLVLMAGTAARWMDSLADSQQSSLALQKGLEARRRDWGNLQWQLEQRGIASRSSDQGKLPFGLLFSAPAPELDGERLWMTALLSRLCVMIYPEPPISEPDLRQALLDMFHRLADCRKTTDAPRADLWDGFSGIISENEDLLAIPLAPKIRDFWVGALTGAPPAQGALFDWIDVASFERASIDSLSPTILSAVLGSRGAAAIVSTRPELREAALANWLDPNALAAFRQMIDLSGVSADQASRGPTINLSP